MATAAFSESGIDLAIRRAGEKLGYSKLRHQQVRAVKNFVQGNDVVVSLPTGSGKSLCYYILPATFDSLFGADSRHLARCIFLSDCDNQILYAFRVNYHYVTAYRADPKTIDIVRGTGLETCHVSALRSYVPRRPIRVTRISAYEVREAAAYHSPL